MVKYLMASKMPVEEMISHKEDEGFIEFAIPFNSMRKRNTTAVRLSDGRVRVFVKGGPDVVMPHCTRMLDAQGNEVELSEEEKAAILGQKVVQKMTSKTYRAILVTYADYSSSDWDNLKRINNNFASEADK